LPHLDMSRFSAFGPHHDMFMQDHLPPSRESHSKACHA
jgi:hypothetical protein